MRKRTSKTSVLVSHMDAGKDHRAAAGDQVETLKERCRFLSGTDRVLMELLLAGRCKHTDLAELLGISQSAVSHRVRRLLALIRQYPHYQRQWQRLSCEDVRISRLTVFDGRIVQQLSNQTGLTKYRVRRITREINRKNKDRRSIL